MELFTCGSCAWFSEGSPPPRKDMQRRGYCTADPPKVFPTPKQSGKITALGQQKMEIVPMMMRPIVEGNEPMCRFYQPNEWAMLELGDKSEDQEEEETDGS